MKDTTENAHPKEDVFHDDSFWTKTISGGSPKPRTHNKFSSEKRRNSEGNNKFSDTIKHYRFNSNTLSK